MDVASRKAEKITSQRQTIILRAAEERGLLGAKDHMVEGKLPGALVEQAKRVSGIAETTDLLIYALARIAVEHDLGERL